MLRASLIRVLCVGWSIVPLVAPAAVKADPAKDRFHEAYYLETAVGDWAGAAKLYERIADDSAANAELRAEAKQHLAACREEAASSDFAKLMPADAWAYIEVNRPGDQIMRLVKQLGLAADADRVATEGGKRVAISPALVKEVLGVRGLAVAITGFDPIAQMPMGVLIFHPGNIEVVRGLIETGLPVGGTAVEAIGGFPTYDVEGETLVTLTKRLVIVGRQRAGIEGVVDRLRGKDKKSLAENEALADARRDGADSLLMFFVNVKPLLPMIKGGMAMGAMRDPKLAMASAVLDPDSLQSLSGRLGIADDGIHLDLGLRLAEGHHNLAFNLLRTPGIDPGTLKGIPAGAAAVVVAAMNSADSQYNSGSGGKGGAPAVSALDLGREVFANITSFAVFVLPPEGGETSAGGPPIPDVAAIFTVHDPAKSQALWTTALGVGSMAAGGPAIEGEAVDFDGVAARSFTFPNGVTAYFAVSDHDVLISPSRTAMAAALKVKRGGKSLMKDEAFAAGLTGVSPDTTKVVLIHAGRATEIAKRFAPARDIEEAAQFFPLLKDTVVALSVDYSDRAFRLSAALTGIPDVGDTVAKLVTEEMGGGRQASTPARPKRPGTSVEKRAKKDAGGEKAATEALDAAALRKKFDGLALERKDRETAAACATKLFDAIEDDARALNNFAWALLTEDRYENGYDELALKFTKRSNELTDQENWAYLDTLALAQFKTGDAEGAVKIERKAIELCDGPGLDDLKKALARFEAAVKESGKTSQRG